MGYGYNAPKFDIWFTLITIIFVLFVIINLIILVKILIDIFLQIFLYLMQYLQDIAGLGLVLLVLFIFYYAFKKI